ncbi:MAG: response regulator [Magnetococcus sp. YQC-9]
MRPPETSKIILADSRPDAMDSLTNLVCAHYPYIAVYESGQLFRELARSTGQSIVMLDVAISSFLAFDVCRQIKGNRLHNSTVILISYHSDSAAEWQAVVCGADEFFFLPMHPELFQRRLERFAVDSSILRSFLKANKDYLQVQKQLSESMIEFGINPLVIFDCDGVIVRFNHQAELLFAASVRNTLGKNIVEWIAPENRAIFLAAVQAVCAQADPTPRFVRKIRTTGVDSLDRRITLEVALSVISLDHRLLFAASMHDVSDLKLVYKVLSESLSLAERRVLKEQQELQRIKQSERNASIALRTQQTINTLLQISLDSGSLQEKLQRSLEQVIRLPLINSPESAVGLYLFDSALKHFERVSDIPNGVMPAQWLCPHASLDCTSCLISLYFSEPSISIIEDQLAGKVDYCLPFHSNTDLIGALRIIVSKDDIATVFENAIFDSIGKVLVYIISRARIDQALRESQERAEAANRSKSEFLANMSHEIRSPLNAIIGMTDLVLNTNLVREELLGNLEIVRSSSLSLLDLINGILDLSKIEAGHFQLERISFDLFGQLEEVCAMLAIKAHQKGLELYNQIPSDLPLALEGDPVRLKQIIVNLINNAIKFTNSGDIVLTVEHVVRPKANQDPDLWLRFSVRDSGIGIPEALQNTIFQSFVQADGSIARKYGGTGLGLTISRHLVEMMGGTLQVESREGEGSCFFFSIPFTPVQKPETLEPWMNLRQREHESAKHAQLQGRRILLVDGHATGADIVENLLRYHGAQVIRAGSRDAMIGQMERQADDPFDLLLADEAIMQGCDCLARNPYLHYQSRIIVMVSTHLTSRNFILAGVFRQVAIIKKPVRQFHLVKKIVRMLASQETSSAEDDPVTLPPIPKAAQPLEILLVEDLPANQKLACDILTLQGHRVALANNGVEALDLLKGGSRFDLILLDLQMPIMDGFETTRRIRGGAPAEVGNPDVPIVAVSAMVMMNEKQRCHEIGMNGFLLKPYQTHELMRVVAAFSKVHKPPPRQPVVGEIVLAAVDTDEETLRQFRQNFVVEAPDHLRQLQHSLLLSDLGNVIQEGNWLRTMAGHIGATRLASHAIRLTGQAEMEAWDDALTMYPNLEQYVEALVQRLAKKGVA